MPILPNSGRPSLISEDDDFLAPKPTRKRGEPKPPAVPSWDTDIGLVDVVYKGIKAGWKSWVPKNVYASKLKECDLQLVFGMLGFTQEDIGKDNPHWSFSADQGTVLHDLLERHSKNHPGFRRSEFRVRSACGSVTGRADLELEIDGKLVGVDWKTVGSKDFAKGPASDKFKGYQAQMDAYAFIEGWDRAVIVLVNRDDGRMREVELEVDKQRGQALVENAARLIEAARNKQLVEPSVDQPGGKDCFFCPFKVACRNRAGVSALLRKGLSPLAADRQLGQLGENERAERLAKLEEEM